MAQQNLANADQVEEIELDEPAMEPVYFRGRFMTSSGKEFPCAIAEMSTHKALFTDAEKPELGEKIIVYVQELGRFIGIVDRHESSSFGATLNLSEAKRARIAKKLAWHVKQGADRGRDRRKKRRTVPMRQITQLRLLEGTEHFGKIIDITSEGAEIATSLILPVGINLYIDGRLAKIVSLFEGGIDAEFLEEDVLYCRGYGVAFGSKVVLADVTLSLPPRCVTVLMGPSGTGKSTLLRSFAALFTKNEIFRSWGSAHYHGAPISLEHSPELVMQRIEMTQRTALESLLFHVGDDTLGAEDQRAKIVSWLEQIGATEIVEHFDRAFIDLERALQRKVAILREAAARPALLMIDEPTSGLADEDAADILRIIELVAQQMSVLVVLHNQKQARQIGKSIILLAGGRVQEHSPTEQFFASGNEITQKFIATGSCSVPAPDASPDVLSDDISPPPPLPAEALGILRAAEAPDTAAPSGADEAGATAVKGEPAQPETRWLDALPPKEPTYAPGPHGFHWIVEGRLAGAARPGAVNDIGYELDLLKDAGVTTLVTLTETNFPQGPLVLRRMDNVHLPIPDGKAPSIGSVMFLLRRMRQLLESGRVIAVHCLQGAGRTGTILAACLIEGGGMTAQEAISHLRSKYPEYVKTEEQEAFLSAFENAVHGRG